jgi:protein-S-isoprenylcysteine O-methyltransferase Ste14
MFMKPWVLTLSLSASLLGQAPKVRLPEESTGIDGVARTLISASDQVDILALGEAHGKRLDKLEVRPPGAPTTQARLDGSDGALRLNTTRPVRSNRTGLQCPRSILVMGEPFASEIIGTAGLTLAAGVALLLAVLRRPLPGRAVQRHRMAPLLVVGLCCQAAHFAEEYATGFYRRFPETLGLAPWSSAFFIIFNMCWFVIWVWAAFGFREGYRLAFFPVWFFALAATVNAVTHPLLAFHASGYFPGLVTSPLLGVVGVWLLIGLVGLTEPDDCKVSFRRIILFVEAVAFSIIVPGAVVYWIPLDLLGLWGEVVPHPWSVWRVAALLPVGAGLAVYLKCLWEFAVRGRGIPAPLDHPKQLVVTGLYQYVRNPMYIGVLLVLVGEASFFQSSGFLLYSLGWLLFVHVNVLVYEEPNLTRKFGTSYLGYKAVVHRWIPGRRYPGRTA